MRIHPCRQKQDGRTAAHALGQGWAPMFTLEPRSPLAINSMELADEAATTLYPRSSHRIARSY
jgi:hypothetical protein